MVELVRVDVKRDAGARVAELSRRPNRVDASADQMARERVAKVVEAELRHSFSVQAGGIRSLVESALRDIVPVERRPVCTGEQVRVRTW